MKDSPRDIGDVSPERKKRLDEMQKAWYLFVDGNPDLKEKGSKETKENREFDNLWQEYADSHRGDVQVNWVAASIREAAGWFYKAGRKAENAEWEESDPGFVEEDIH